MAPLSERVIYHRPCEIASTCTRFLPLSGCRMARLYVHRTESFSHLPAYLLHRSFSTHHLPSLHQILETKRGCRVFSQPFLNVAQTLVRCSFLTALQVGLT